MASYRTGPEAASAFARYLSSLDFDSLPEKEHVRAEQVMTDVITDFRRAISVSSEEQRHEVIGKIRELLTELERMLSGQMVMFAGAGISARVATRYVEALNPGPKVTETFKELFEILDSLDEIIENDTMRQLGMKPKPVTPGKAKKAPKTYKQAQDQVLEHMRQKGWAVVAHLKIPHATKGEVRFWFKPQAIYVSKGASMKDFGSARSMWAKDYRFIDPKEFAEGLEKYASQHGA